MDYRQEYDKWCNDPYFDDQTREELKAIAGDDKEIEDRFYRTPGVWNRRIARGDRCGNQSYEYLHGRQATQGPGKLYSGTGRTGERCGNRT